MAHSADTGPDAASSSAQILRRMLKTPSPEARPEGMTLQKALSQAVKKAAESEVDLVIGTSNFQEARRALDPALEDMPLTGLHLVLEGRDGARGFIHISGALLQGIIQAQTLGFVTSDIDADRAPTGADSALCEGFLTEILTQFGEALANTPDHDWASGFKVTGGQTGPRQLGLLLDDIALRKLEIEVSLGESGVSGRFTVCLPIAFPSQGGKDKKDNSDAFSQALQQSLADTKARLQVVMHRYATTLDGVSALEVGSVLPIPRSALTSAGIEATTGKCISQGKLGQLDGFRAVRVLSPEQALEQAGALEHAVDHTEEAALTAPTPQITSPPPAPPAEDADHQVDSPPALSPEESDPQKDALPA